MHSFLCFQNLSVWTRRPGTYQLLVILFFYKNKRAWNGVFFNQQHCPIFVINKVEFFDSPFYVMSAKKLKTWPTCMRLNKSRFFIFVFSSQKVILIKILQIGNNVTMIDFSSDNSVLMTGVYSKILNTPYGSAPIRCGTYR